MNDINLRFNPISSIEELKTFLKEFFNGKEVEIFLFGSRAKGNFRPTSDIDLAVLSEDDISYQKLIFLLVFSPPLFKF
jgi:predicted nucleotidyltransferase